MKTRLSPSIEFFGRGWPPIFGAFLLMVTARPALAHKEDYLDDTFVYVTVGKGVAELEYGGRWIQESRRANGQEFWTNGTHFEYGLSDDTMVEVAGLWGTAESTTGLGGSFLQVRHRFGNEGEYPVDVALGLEYEREREEGDLGRFLVPSVVLSKDFGEWNMTANGFLQHGLDSGSRHDWEWQSSFGIRYGRQGLRYGLEVKELGATRRYVLPEVTVPMSRALTLKLGVGTHLSPRSPRLIGLLLLEWEIGEKENGKGD